MRNLFWLILIGVFIANNSCLPQRHKKSRCLDQLQEEIKTNWIILEDIGALFPVTYQRNDVFCNKVCNEYSKCLINKKSKEDIKVLFGQRGINLQYLVEYHFKRKGSSEIMRLEFVFNELDTLKEIRYRSSQQSDL
jgi:hypothetical protein